MPTVSPKLPDTRYRVGAGRTRCEPCVASSRSSEKEPESFTKIWDTFGTGSRKASTRTSSAATRCSPRPLQDDCVGGRVAQPQELRRRAQGEPDRDLLPRGRRFARLETSPHLSRRLPRPRRRGAAAAGYRRQLLGHVDVVVRGQAVQVGDPGTADLAQIPRLDAKDEPQPETDAAPLAVGIEQVERPQARHEWEGGVFVAAFRAVVDGERG
jgi:hypothetical protein